MPLLQKWNINNLGRAAIWKVEEPEAFFAEQTGLASVIKSDKRRIEPIVLQILVGFGLIIIIVGLAWPNTMTKNLYYR